MDPSSCVSIRAAEQHTRISEATPCMAPAPQPLPHTTLPLYYIERPGITHHTASGTVTSPGPSVPLIAIDQLPTWVDVLGVPRELNREQVINLSRLGVAPKGKPYEVYITPALSSGPNIRGSQMNPTARPFVSQRSQVSRGENTMSSNGRQIKDGTASASMPGNSIGGHPPIGLQQRMASPAPLNLAPENPYPVLYKVGSDKTRSTVQRRKDLAEHPAERLLQASKTSDLRHTKEAGYNPLSSVSSRSSSFSSSTTTVTTKRPNMSTSQRGLNSNVSSNKNKSRASATQKTNKPHKSKIHCRNWCQHGTCRFEKKCRYLHEMPLTAQGLREAGLADYPSWWVVHLELMSKHVNKMRTAAAAQQQQKQRRDRPTDAENQHGGGHGDDSSSDDRQTAEDGYYPQRCANRAITKHRERRRSWGGASTSPDASDSSTYTIRHPGRSLNASAASSETLTAIPAQAPTAPGTRLSSPPSTNAKTRTRLHTQELRTAKRVGAHFSRGQHHHSVSHSPDVFERELALAAAAAEEKWAREQAAKVKMGGEMSPVEGRRGQDVASAQANRKGRDEVVSLLDI
ncbi:hypothetical protein GGS24DRAFT_460641 [Hypoxylon argillaceum]|nr:hypothetical protein GGS24DRAFT_460641 [Hypoxylon argillaceum]